MIRKATPSERALAVAFGWNQLQDLELFGTDNTLALDALPSDVMSYHKIETQALTAVCHTNKYEPCLFEAKSYRLDITPFSFYSIGNADAADILQFLSGPVAPDRTFTAVTSFGDAVSAVWASEATAKKFLSRVFCVLQPGSVFLGVAPNGSTMCPNGGNMAPFGNMVTAGRYLVFKSNFKTLAEFIGFRSVKIEEVDGSFHFFFKMVRPA